MKKLTAILLCAMLLSGCMSHAFEDSASFYYRRKEFQHHAASPVIAAEQREVTGHRQDLEYLLKLYLMGPLDEHLSSPLPAGVRLLSVTAEGSNLIVELTDTGRSLNDAAFSLACACITMTCRELTNATTVTVVSGSRSLTSSGEDILLTDDYSVQE